MTTATRETAEKIAERFRPKFVRMYTDSRELADAIDKAISDEREAARREQAETDAQIAEAWDTTTATRPQRYIARAIRRAAGALKTKTGDKANGNEDNPVHTDQAGRQD